MPGPISDSNPGRNDDSPYVPSWNYPKGEPKVCPCGHHEGYHNDKGSCLHSAQCGCEGLPSDCFTTDKEFCAQPTPTPSRPR